MDLTAKGSFQMKRSSQDIGGPNPQVKRLAGDQYADDKRNLTTGDALSYLRDVKAKFANNRRVYDR